MRTTTTLVHLLASAALVAQGTWLPRTSLTLGAPRWGVAEFAIDGVGYVVGGHNGNADLSEARAYIAASNT